MNFDEIKYVRKQTRQILDLLTDLQRHSDDPIPHQVFQIETIVTELQHNVTLCTGNDTELAKKVDHAMFQGDF